MQSLNPCVARSAKARVVLHVQQEFGSFLDRDNVVAVGRLLYALPVLLEGVAAQRLYLPA